MDNGHNASHYFYLSPINKAHWKNDLHEKDMHDLFGFDPFLETDKLINGKTYLSHFDIPFSNSFELTTEYPGLLIGAGYSHYAINSEKEDSDYQIGFFFDHTLGIPIIPGSSIKGVLKSVFPNKTSESDKLDYVNEKVKNIVGLDKLITHDNWKKIFFENGNVFFQAYPFCRINDNISKAEFESSENTFKGIKDRFEKEKLVLEKQIKELKTTKTKTKQEEEQLKNLEKKLSQIRKKHDKDKEVYNEAENKFKISQRIIVDDAITPHHPGEPDAIFKEPIPLKFIKVPAGITFKFQFRINDYKKDGIELLSKNICDVFKQILIDFGIGAKRNVGYGNLKP